MQPFVKWVGGKRQLLPEIEKYIPAEYDTYFEACVGGGALFCKLAPKKAVINDWNPELVTCYRVIKNNPQALIDRLNELTVVEDRRKVFTEYRQVYAPGLTDVERAARLIFLNKNCFNGLYRENKKGIFNSPFGAYKKPPALFKEDNILAYHKGLKNTLILQGDFQDAVETAKPGDFVYFDPPYVPLNPTSAFTSYTAEGFGKKTQERLADTFKRLHSLGVHVILSNSDTPLVRELYAGYDIHTIQARRSVNSVGSKRGYVPEVLVVGVHGVHGV